MISTRYIIGIDLGTTNSSVTYVDCDVERNPSLAVHLFRIPQHLADGVVGEGAALPSFHYLATEGEVAPLPWQKQGSRAVVGEYAREAGKRSAQRQVRSAKSWLCEPSARRQEPILPVEAISDTEKISPVEASKRYLEHIRDAWNARMGADSFDQQQIVLTVPASFDEVARTLTAQAAKAAGIRHLTLLEEPLAAFYSWLDRPQTACRSVEDGARILVCDVGGGTTDFSLIDAADRDGEQSYQRMAVGKHLLLGGDNLDAAVCHYLEQQLNLSHLDSLQWLQLSQEARHIKEQALSTDASTLTVHLRGSGSQLIGGAITGQVEAAPIRQLLLDGFFAIESYETARRQSTRSAVRTMGLAYESEPSIIRHLAAFLDRAGGAPPTHVLFNGGTMACAQFRERILHALRDWFSDEGIAELPTRSLDLAVAYGATIYGKARRGYGMQVRSGLAHALYVRVDAGGQEPQAMAVVPRGSEEGTCNRLDHPFRVRANTPVVFELYASHTRLHDQLGQLVAVNEELGGVGKLATVLKYGAKGNQESIEVRLEVLLTPVGTVELWLQSVQSNHRWQLEFSLRGEDLEQSRQDLTFDRESLAPARAVIEGVFDGSGVISPKDVMPRLEDAIGSERSQWAPGVLRGLWDSLVVAAPKRGVSPRHAARWWHLVGYVLRPGYGSPLDAERIGRLWKLILQDRNGRSEDEELQRMICLRRLAGGLSKGQQRQLGAELTKQLYDNRGKINPRSGVERTHAKELIRTLGSFEFLESTAKKKLGSALLERLGSDKATEADYWALGRLGARELLYGGVADLLPAEVVEGWIERLLKLDGRERDLPFLLVQLARRTDVRASHIQPSLFDQVRGVVQGSAPEMLPLLDGTQPLSREQQALILADDLPVGLVLDPS